MWDFRNWIKELFAWKPSWQDGCDHHMHTQTYGPRGADSFAYILGEGWRHWAPRLVDRCCRCGGVNINDGCSMVGVGLPCGIQSKS